MANSTSNANSQTNTAPHKYGYYVLNVLIFFCAAFLLSFVWHSSTDDTVLLLMVSASVVVLTGVSSWLLFAHFKVEPSKPLDVQDLSKNLQLPFSVVESLSFGETSLLLTTVYQPQSSHSFFACWQSQSFKLSNVSSSAYHLLPKEYIDYFAAGKLAIDENALQEVERRWDKFISEFTNNTDRDSIVGHFDCGYQLKEPQLIDVSEKWYVATIAQSEALLVIRAVVLNASAGDESSEVYEQDMVAEVVAGQQKMDALVRFADGIAHDYNNLFGIVNGYTELMTSHLDNSQKLSDYIEHIQSASVRAEALGEQVLALSRRRKAGQVLVDFEQVIFEPLLIFKKNLPDSIKFDWVLAKTEQQVLLEPPELEGIIFALGENALTAMEDKGTLRIVSNVESLSQQKAQSLGIDAGEYLCFSVIDNGAGMNEEQLTHALEPYYSTTSGCGFGLARVYGFITNCHGAIAIDSALGQGTRVSLYFPLHSGADA